MRYRETSALTLPQHTGCWRATKLLCKARDRLKNALMFTIRGSLVKTVSMPKEQVSFPKAQHQGWNESDQLQSQKRSQKRPRNLTDDDGPRQKRPRTQGTQETPELSNESKQPAQSVCEALTLPQHTGCWKVEGKKHLSELEELDQSPSAFFWSPLKSPGELLQKARDRLKNALMLTIRGSLVKTVSMPKEQVSFPKAQHQGWNKSDQPQSQKRSQKRPRNLTDDEEPQQKRPRTQGTQETPELSNESKQPAQSVCEVHLNELYEVGELLGAGGFGSVFAGRRKKDDLPVAIKYVSKQEGDETLEIAGHGQMPIEVALMSLVSAEPSCSNILQCLEWYDEPNRYIMILERPEPCVDLVEFCKMNGGSLTEGMARIIMYQLIEALRHCRSRGIMHRDVKPENILIQTDTLKVKLFDFGCGDLIKGAYNEFAGTREYMPPEWFKERRYLADPATVWSVGVTLYRLVCGCLPFKTCKQIKRGHLRFTKKLSQECNHLIRWCLRGKAADRPTLKEMLFQHWFYLPD